MGRDSLMNISEVVDRYLNEEEQLYSVILDTEDFSYDFVKSDSDFKRYIKSRKITVSPTGNFDTEYKFTSTKDKLINLIDEYWDGDSEWRRLIKKVV
jgi:hypothetical protein